MPSLLYPFLSSRTGLMSSIWKIRPTGPAFAPWLALVHNNWTQRTSKCQSWKGPEPLQSQLESTWCQLLHCADDTERSMDSPKVTQRAPSRARAIKLTPPDSRPSWPHFFSGKYGFSIQSEIPSLLQMSKECPLLTSRQLVGWSFLLGPSLCQQWD